MNKIRNISLTMMLMLPTVTSYAQFSFQSTTPPWLWLNAGEQVYNGTDPATSAATLAPGASSTDLATDGQLVNVWQNLADPTRYMIPDYGSVVGRTPPSYANNPSSWFNFHPVVHFDNPGTDLDPSHSLILNAEFTSKLGSNGLALFTVARAKIKNQSSLNASLNKGFIIDYGCWGTRSSSLGLVHNVVWAFTPQNDASDRYLGAPPNYAFLPSEQGRLLSKQTGYASTISSNDGTINVAMDGTNVITGIAHAASLSTIAPINYRMCHHYDANPVVRSAPTAVIGGGPFTLGNESRADVITAYGQVAANAFNGDIAEVLSFDSLLDATQTEEVQTYLAIKYGISLMPAEYTAYQTKIWTATGTHDHDIVGLVHNSAAGIDQRVTHSASPDAILTFATNTDFTSANGEPTDEPIMNGRTAFADGDAVVIGNTGDSADANGHALYTTANIPKGYQRMVRTWKTQTTPVAPAINFQVNTVNPLFNMGNVSHGLLYVTDQNNGDFSQNTPVLLTKTAPDQYMASKVALTNGQQFTLAKYAVDYEFANVTMSGEESVTAVNIPLLVYSPMPKTDPITINLSISGTAVNGTDFTMSSSYVIPADDYRNGVTLNVPLTVIHNTLVAPDQTVIVKITGSDNPDAFLYDLNGTDGANDTTTYTIINDNANVKVKPDYLEGLTCTPIPVQFSLADLTDVPFTNKTGTLVVQTQGSNGNSSKICPTANTADSRCQIGMYTQTLDATNQDSVTLYISSSVSDEVTITDVKFNGRESDDIIPTAPIILTYSPFVLMLKGQDPLSALNMTQMTQLVAGQPSNKALEVIGNVNSTCRVLSDYTGTKSFNISAISYQQPMTGTSQIAFNGNQTTNAAQTGVSIKFNQGISLPFKLQYNDAGIVNVTLTDPAYTWCKKAYDPAVTTCAPADLMTLSNTIQIESRPYTFALCQMDGSTLPQGNVTSGPLFGHAGVPFNIMAKPVLWQVGDPTIALNGDVDNSGNLITPSATFKIDVSASGYCARKTTPNFVKTGAPIGTVVMTSQLDTPSGGNVGVFNSVPTSIISNRADSAIALKPLTWSEVGSLQLVANANYLGMVINPGSSIIGRFAPDHFQMSNDLITKDHTLFNYMDEPFSVSYNVTAENAQNGATQNYDYFSNTLRDNINLSMLLTSTAVAGTPVQYDQFSQATRLKLINDLGTGLWTGGIFNVNQGFIFTKGNLPDGSYPIWFALSEDDSLKASADHVPLVANVNMKATSNAILPAATLSTAFEFKYGKLDLLSPSCVPNGQDTIKVQALYYHNNVWLVNTDDSDTVFLDFLSSYIELDTVHGNDDNLISSYNTGYLLKSKSDTTLTNGVANIEEKGAGHNSYWLSLVQGAINLPWLSNTGTNSLGNESLKSEVSHIQFNCIKAGKSKVIYRSVH